jgi:hypothetical protein
MVKKIRLTTEQLEKIENAREVKIHYAGPHETKWAVVRYYCRKGKPLKVASYYIYGEELKSGKQLICWHWQPSTNFNVVEDSFNTEEEAITRMKELRLSKYE